MSRKAQLVGSGDPGVEGIGTSNGAVGVRGLMKSGLDGIGVLGIGRGDAFFGVQGEGQNGVVGNGTRGRPTSGSHQKGEIYLDSAGAIFVCARSGTPGTWRKVTTTSA